jgi:hypothetical protein
MKSYLNTALLLVLSFAIGGCQSTDTTRLEATNQALAGQVNSLIAELTQQASQPEATAGQPITEPAGMGDEIVPPTQTLSAAPSPQPTQASSGVAPSLIFSGSGTITPWSNKTAFPIVLFGAANVHLVCDPNDPADGKLWIDNKNYAVGCNANSESWVPWKQDITVGDHYIYSQNANDQYEFWTIGTAPFTIRNKYESSDFMFDIQDPGIYKLSANLIKGAFNVYITCEGAQNFNYPIAQSTTIQVVLNPARCELIIRDSPPGTLTPGEIEVSLEKAK